MQLAANDMVCKFYNSKKKCVFHHAWLVWQQALDAPVAISVWLQLHHTTFVFIGIDMMETVESICWHVLGLQHLPGDFVHNIQSYLKSVHLHE